MEHVDDEGYWVRRLSDGVVLPMALPPDRVRSEGDGQDAVMAHALLTSVTAVTEAISVLRDQADTLTPADRDRFLATAEHQLAHVSGMLTDLVRGLPADAVMALEELRAPDADAVIALDELHALGRDDSAQAAVG